MSSTYEHDPTTCPHCQEKHSINLQEMCGSMHGAVKVELEIGPAYGEVTLCVKGPRGCLTLIAEDDVGLTDSGCMEGYLVPTTPPTELTEQEPMADRPDFLSGYVAACQNLVAMRDKPSVAEDLLLHSCFGRQELLAAQRASGFRSREMCPLIRAATEGRGSGAGTPVRAGEAV